ncbi:uncharacterized protein LOC118191985 [Stegodyphus dumicola]|uniref:uncharacterized protein LOC118191985 n=1 Tax=Stegodyphus dumicola TaxID=202533 RepID=UPI0015B01A1B|nr:uncharacterized protein LOC118191985 [Stegodyphus dumicola]
MIVLNRSLKMKTSWQVSTLVVVILAAIILEVYCRPSDETNGKLRERRQAVEDRQFIGGLSTLGALIQPILFMIGMANFMGRIPMFFNRVRDRFSSTLSGTGAPAGAGRKKRSVGGAFDDDTDEKSLRALRMLDEAEEKYNMRS